MVITLDNTAEPKRAYSVPRHPAPIDLRLDGNEGQAIATDIASGLSAVTAESLRRYPSTEELAANIAEVYGIDSAQVLVTSGADDGLLRMCRAYLAPGKNIVLPTPTFEMIERFADWCFATIRRVDWSANAFPLQAVLDTTDDETGLIAVVSPNNPTGSVITEAELRTLSKSRPNCMLMVDCAYTEFAETDLTAVGLTLPNAVVFRTFSKALGLAGLRCGYALGSESAMAKLRAVGMPYPVSAPSIAVAREALKRRDDTIPFIEAVKVERDELANTTTLGFEVKRSEGNFIFAEIDRPAWWRDCLAGLGIGVRIFPNKPGLERAMRITCPGNSDEFARLIEAFNTIAAPEALLFDIDGVLADVSGPIVQPSLRQPMPSASP